jgi:RNA 2',3'-cyclic 3'-phosphodiesterase
MRLFIAFDVPHFVEAYLKRLQTLLRQADFFEGTYVLPENFHLTMLFLGDVPEDTLPAVINTTIDVDRMSQPSVIWVNVVSDELQELFHTLCKHLRSQEKQPIFHPHITIVRIKKMLRASKLAQVLDELPTERIAFQPKEIKLKQSQLTATGAVYTNLFIRSLGD